MTDDPRCCGSGMCIIDPSGRCWCGQQWDGQKMVTPPLNAPAASCGGDGSAPRSEAGHAAGSVLPEVR